MEKARFGEDEATSERGRMNGRFANSYVVYFASQNILFFYPIEYNKRRGSNLF